MLEPQFASTTCRCIREGGAGLRAARLVQMLLSPALEGGQRVRKSVAGAVFTPHGERGAGGILLLLEKHRSKPPFKADQEVREEKLLRNPGQRVWSVKN